METHQEVVSKNAHITQRTRYRCPAIALRDTTITTLEKIEGNGTPAGRTWAHHNGKRLRANLTTAEDNPLVAGELLKPHRTTGVELLSAYAYLSA